MYRVVITVVLISWVAFISCKQKQPPPTLPVPVNLDTVTAQGVLYYDKYPATTEAMSQVDLRPEVQGYITGIFFTEGSFVKKGQKLYEVDRRLYQQAYDAAAANLRVAEGNRVQAKQDADRYEYLNAHNAVAKQVLDHAVITLQNAENSVKAADEALKTAKTNLTFSEIYAPFDGTIGFSQVKMGNLVSVGTTILNTISTNDPMAVDFLINEKQLNRFEELEKNKKKQVDSLFTIILPNNSVYPFVGKISVIDRAVDPQTGALRIRLQFPNPKHSLKAGMSCVVRVHNQEASPQILIPGKAIVEQMGEYFVFVAKDTILNNAADSANQKSDDKSAAKDVPKLRAFQKKVQLGETIGANVIVLSGISEGEKIVVDGVQTLREGSEISTSNKPATSQKGKDSSNK